MNVANDADVRLQPGLHELEMTGLSPLTLGTDYQVYVKVFTKEGEISSDVALITLADVPD